MKLPGAALGLALASALALPWTGLADPPAASVAPSTPAKPAPKQEESIGHIDGMEIARPGGGFLGLRLVNNNFVLTFYDAKKHKITPNVARAAARWPVHYQPAPERAVLNPGFDAASLTSPKIVRPPHDFKLYLSLFVEGSDDAVESYVLDFHD